MSGTVSITAPLRVGARGVDFSSVWRSEPFADDWSDAATAGDASEGIGDRSARTLRGTPVVSGVSVDGRSLAALANALDERSLDAERSFDDASSFGEAEAATAEEVIRVSESFNVKAQVVGRVEACEGKSKVTVKSEYGEFTYDAP